MSEQYQVVWPSSQVHIPDVRLSPRVKDMNEAVILEFNHMHYRGVEIFPILREELKRRYPKITIIPWDTIGDFRDMRNFGGYEAEKWPGLKYFIERHHITAAVGGMGA
ncbi:hypothetical protein KQI82_08885 [Oscillibacter sp. MSJ-2]|uniref:Uncharacterized protein n=1 Tax=Dysosmobacter acutus TaxID=2841504 RepID=A0ABS6FAD8_9FIRM|nr:hypothetical protein [Dysosmobacter acutus]MBU5627020.1 hypothetical protein [Dysosmobacter acutus]